MARLTIEQEKELALIRARARRARAAVNGGSTPATEAPSARASLGGVAETISDLNTGVGQGLTLGFNDELSAGLAAPARVAYNAALGRDQGKGIKDRFVEAYNRGLEKHRAILKTAQERSPIAEAAGEVVGGAMSLAGAPGANVGKSVFTRALRAGGEGALYGAGYGAGTGEGFEDRAAKAAIGAPLGFALGAGVTPLADGAVKIGQRYVAPAMRSVFKPSDEAARRVGWVIGKDRELVPGASVPERGMTDAEFAAAQQAGLPVTNIERGGQYTRTLADAATVRSPGARAILDRALNDRHVTQYDRLADTLDGMTAGHGSETVRDALQAHAKAINGPAYKIANMHPAADAMWDKNFEALLQADVMQKAAKKAISTSTNKAAMQGFTPIRHPFAVDPATDRLTLSPAGTNGSRAMPNLGFWDAVKQNLDDEISSLQRTGANGAARDATILKNQLLTHLDSRVPQYRAARQGAAAFIGAQDALDAGIALVNKKVSPEIAFRLYGSMNPQERELAKIGIVNAIKNKLGNLKDVQDLPKYVFADPNSRARLGIFLGKGNMDRLEAQLGAETLMSMARTEVQGNSRTMHRALSSGLTGLSGGAVYGVGTGDHDPMHLSIAALLTAGSRHGAHKASEKLALEIAKKLTSSDKAAYAEAITKIVENPSLLATVRAISAPAAVYGTQRARLSE